MSRSTSPRTNSGPDPNGERHSDATTLTARARLGERAQPSVSRRRFLSAGAAVLGGALMQTSPVGARQNTSRISTTDLKGATLLQGAGCNVIAIPGQDGALMIDGGLAANADALLAAVRSATGSSRIHTLINTHWHPEQTGANEAVGRAGGVIFAHEKTKLSLSNTIYSSIAFKGRLALLPQAADRNKPTRADGSVDFAGQPADYGPMPAAPTPGEPSAHFPKLP